LSRLDVASKLSHFSGAQSNVGKSKEDGEKNIHDISKRIKWEEARERASKALKNAATPDGLVAINIKRLTFFNTDRIQRLLTKARAAEELMTMKRLQEMANDALKTKRPKRGCLGKLILMFENVFLPEMNREAEAAAADDDGELAQLAATTSVITARGGSIPSSVLKIPKLRRTTSEATRGSTKSGASSGRRSSSNTVSTGKTYRTAVSRARGGGKSSGRRIDIATLAEMGPFAADKAWYETNPRIYFNIRTPLMSKTTAAVVLPNNTEEDVLVDALLHFTFNINPLKESSENIFTIQMIGFLPSDETKHYIVAEKHFYLIDIIRASCVADVYKFKSVMKELLLAEVEMEMCYGYGMFGYGYSNQLLNAGKPITEGVARSIFIRADPGAETEKVKDVKGQQDTRIKGHAPLAPKVTHPSYLDYRNRLEIRDSSAICKKLDGSDRPSEAEVDQSVRPPIITLSPEEENRVKRMLQQTQLSSWTAQFNSLTDRRERLVFLKNVVFNEPEVHELHHIKGVKPIDDEPSANKDNLSKFSEMHNVKICYVKNMAGLKLKPEKN